MKSKQSLQLIAVMLVALLAGVSPAWAWDHEDTFTDDGGEQCTFRYSGANMTYSGKSLGADDIRGFRTKVKFDNLNGIYYWEFHQRVCFKTICNKSNTDRKNTSIRGTMYITTNDDVTHKIFDYEKRKGEDRLLITNDNLDYGRFLVSDQTNNGWIEIKFLPSYQLIEEGFKSVRFSNDRLVYDVSRSWGPFEYEKATGGTFTPMPDPTFEWEADGKIRMSAKDIPNGLDIAECLRQDYSIDYTTTSDLRPRNIGFSRIIVSDETVTTKNGNRLDISALLEVAPEYAYANPIWFFSKPYTLVKPISQLFSEDWEQTKVKYSLQPYTHPQELTATYDQWNQTTTLQWMLTESLDDPYEDYGKVECRTDGKWIVLRREKQKETFELLQTITGTKQRYSFTDADCPIDKEYVYRVVFMPEVLESQYGQSPATMPFTGLWEETTVSTVPSVAIRLKQNRSDEDGVSLLWEYNIQDPDAKFSVQRAVAGGTSWTTIARDIAVSVGQPYATYMDLTVSSPCEFYNYRVTTQTLGREFVSNTIEANLPAGSRIKEVKASQGTEERNVVVTWRVAQRGTEETWFSIRRRILGSDDAWTEIGTSHGTASEYTFIDEHTMAGSYYEYAVIAYCKECGETPTMSDMQTAAGFSQARGTITGHISFGTGTAVRDVRVNMVKTSDDGEEDMQQYLSRYIEGEGNGLSWTADSSRYASILNSTKPFTLQFWAQPANGGGSKMELVRLNNTIELGLRRADDTTPYNYQFVQLGQIRNIEPSELSARVSGGSPGINGISESHTKLYDGDPSTKMRASMDNTLVHSTVRTSNNQAVYIESYVLTTADDAAQHPDQNPRSWLIKGKNKASSDWQVIATVTDDTRMEGKNNMSYEYSLDVPGHYSSMEIEILSTHGSDIVQLAELTYRVKEDIVVTKTIDNITVVGGSPANVGSPDNTYYLYAIDLAKENYSVTEFPGLTFSNKDFTHVAARYADSKWTFSVGTDTLHTASIINANNTWNAFKTDENQVTNTPRPTLSFGGNNRLMGTAFKGHVDDVRLWNRSLSDKELDGNYTRMLGGTESSLLLYWPLDEGMQVRDYAFDVACQDGIYMQNHPVVGINAVPSTDVPENLKLYGLTDGQGDYIIRGIPFQQGGTNYKVVPQQGIHEFNPITRSMFVSPTSLTANNIDFEDVSAFPMSGHVYYAGTNIPAEGIQLYVDGEVVTSNGEIQKTDANGYYNISVPIGRHYVEAKLEGHDMVAGGRFPTKSTYNFDNPVQHDFADSTLVNFVGRIGGGLHNDTLAVGFGASKNNIGMAVIQLKLNNESFSFNCQDDHITDALTQRTWQSDTTSINSRAWTGTGYDTKYIYIRTDSITGEFSALLPPLKYITKSIRIDSNREIEFAELPQIDLTNPKKEVCDSLKLPTASGDSIFHYYTYNTKMVRTYYAEPKLHVWQSLLNGEATPLSPSHPFTFSPFGLQAIKDFTDDFGTIDIDDIWKQEADGTVKYQFGYPVYRSFDRVRLGLRGYEAYANYDSGHPVCDTIPLAGQALTIANEMSNDQVVIAKLTNPNEMGIQPGDIYNLKSNQLALDQYGRNELSWTTGLPNIVSPYTRQLSITFERNKRTYLWNDLRAIVLGNLDSGNNFVTLGPDLVTMVLRDPPGATSKTTWKTGETQTKLRSQSQGFYGNEKFTLDTSWGLYIETEVGVGISAVTSKSNVTTDLTTGFTYRVNRNNQTDETWSVTATKAVSTGNNKNFVGSKGDVYIGASTNLIIGETRKLGFFRDGAGYPFRIDLRNAMSMGDSIRTTFMYSAYELEEVMIPKWETTRRSLMTFVNSKAEAQSYVNTSNHCVYVTWLNRDDPNVGVSDTTYIQVPPANWDGTFIDDSVKWCTNQIKVWRDKLADNEEDKVNAINGAQYFRENISFDGGSSYSYTSRNDTTYQKKHNYSHNLGGIVKFGGTSQQVVGGVAFNVKALWDTENGWTMATTDSDYDENTKNWAEFEYSFSDGNKGTDFSVNIYRSPRGWSDIFSLIGGQSYNPYQGEERTKYYQKGQHILSNGTQRMEQPDIQISTDGIAGAKSATLTDVPAGQMGQFTLHLSNNGTTVQGFDFSFDLMVQEMADTLGLEILMDGVPANGRSIFIPAGETVKKIITVRQTDQSILDYEGVEIWLLSQYQPIKINDKIKLNVHFTPSSSPIDLVINEPVLNIEQMQRNDGNLEMKLTNFNRQFKGMKKLGVEYRFEGSTTWTQPSELTFLVNRDDSTSVDDHVLPATGDLRLYFNMKDDNFYPQGTYIFRAYTTTLYDNKPIRVFSDEVSVVKDNVPPRQLTTPTPTNGILSYGDDLSVEFTEDIVPGYVSDKDIIVTAKLNNQNIDHGVAKMLYPAGGEQRTVNPIYISGDFTMELWMLWTTEGTILEHGQGRFVLGLDEEGHVVINLAGNRIVSQKVLPKGEWIFFAMNCNAADDTFSAIAQYGTTTLRLFENEPVPPQSVSVVNYTEDNHVYLGHMLGAIHDLCIYSICLNLDDVCARKNQAKNTYTYGLMNHWPMNEGHGEVAADARHTHDFSVTDFWLINNDNYSLEILNDEPVQADISRINTTQGDSYAIELWAMPGNFTDEREVTIFETGSKPADKIRLYYDKDFNLMLQYGEKSQMVVAYQNITGYHQWDHYALNVVRGQSVSFYYNGKRTAVISERDFPPIQGATIKLGENLGYEGRIDELRIWHATLSENRLLSNIYNTIDTASVYSRGLVAYYPFEKNGVQDGVETIVSTIDNMLPEANGNLLLSSDWQQRITRFVPPLKNAPQERRLNATPVASNRRIVINLNTTDGVAPRDIEGSTLNITVDKIYDQHGNRSEPIRWTAYMQMNTLKWTRDSITVIKHYGDEYTFDVNITNKGGNTEFYTLYNMPSWLTLVSALDGQPVETTGDLAPLSVKTLRFSVNPYVPVGNYNISIGLQGNDEILEPLRIVMKVRGEMPDWSVDPTRFENSMSLVGQISINGMLIGNSESRVAAFIGNECRGIAAPRAMRGAAYVPLSIYGTAQQDVNGKPADLDKGQPITFRIWDAAVGVAYTNVHLTLPDGTVTDTLYFDPTQNYGTFDTPVIFTKSNNVEQPLVLRKGWNWLALGVEPVNAATSVVFKDISSWNVRLKDQSTGTAYCNGVYWSGNLKQVHANTMYKMLLNPLQNSKELPQPLTVVGEQVKLSDTPVTIEEGWNWIAYLPSTTMTLNEALAGANPLFGDQVKSQTAFAYYGPYGWEGNLEALESGKGYLYQSHDAVTKTFTYPTISAGGLLQGQSRAESPRKAQSFFSPIAPTSYPDNMSIVIMLTSGGQPVADAEVAVFIDDECRAAAVADDVDDLQQLPLYYLLVPGQGSGQPIELRVAIGSEVLTLATTLTYSSDASIGTPWEPFVIDISGLTAIANVTVSYDHGVWYSLQGIRLGTTKPSVPGIYLRNGQAVVVK